MGATLQDCRRAIQTGLPKPPLSNFRRAIAAVSTQEIELRSVPVISFRPADFLVHKSKRAEVITLNEDADWLDFPNGATQQGVHDWFPFHWKRDVLILLAFFVLFFLLFSVLTTIMRMMLNGLSSVLFRAMRSRSRAMIVAFVLTMALIALPLLLLSHHAISRLRVAYDKAEAAYVNYYIDHSVRFGKESIIVNLFSQSASEEKVQNNDETYNNISPIDIIAIVMAGISIMAVAATVWIAIRRIAYWRLRAFSSDDILFIHDRFDYVTDRSVIPSVPQRSDFRPDTDIIQLSLNTRQSYNYPDSSNSVNSMIALQREEIS